MASLLWNYVPDRKGRLSLHLTLEGEPFRAALTTAVKRASRFLGTELLLPRPVHVNVRCGMRQKHVGTVNSVLASLGIHAIQVASAGVSFLKLAADNLVWFYADAKSAELDAIGKQIDTAVPRCCLPFTSGTRSTGKPTPHAPPPGYYRITLACYALNSASP